MGRGARAARRGCVWPAPLRTLGAVVGAWIAAAAASGAAPAVSSPAYAACMDKANSTSDMQACQAIALAEAQTRLRAAYARALNALPPDQQAQLRQAQQRWVAFRLSDCRTFYGRTAGSSATVAAGACMIARTEERIRDLRGFIPGP